MSENKDFYKQMMSSSMRGSANHLKRWTALNLVTATVDMKKPKRRMKDGSQKELNWWSNMDIDEETNESTRTIPAVFLSYCKRYLEKSNCCPSVTIEISTLNEDLEDLPSQWGGKLHDILVETGNINEDKGFIYFQFRHMYMALCVGLNIGKMCFSCGKKMNEDESCAFCNVEQIILLEAIHNPRIWLPTPVSNLNMLSPLVPVSKSRNLRLFIHCGNQNQATNVKSKLRESEIPHSFSLTDGTATQFRQCLLHPVPIVPNLTDIAALAFTLSCPTEAANITEETLPQTAHENIHRARATALLLKSYSLNFTGWHAVIQPPKHP